MTPEAQRIAIRAALGWKPRHHGVELYAYERADDAGNWLYAHEMPDHLNDLNACFEMEKALTKEECRDYHDELINAERPSLIECLNGGNYASRWTWNSTPEQRCEAFLKAKGLWQP